MRWRAVRLRDGLARDELSAVPLRMLAALVAATVLAGQHPAGVVAGGALLYAVTALVLVALHYRFRLRQAAYLAVASDAVALAVLVAAATGVSPLPPWTLGALAVLAAATVGAGPIIAASLTLPAAVVGGALAGTAMTTAEGVAAGAALGVLGTAVLLVVRRYLDAQRAALAWQGFVRASAPVNAAVASGEVAAAVARGAVDVAGADGARVWRRVHGRTDYVPAAGAGTRSGLKAVALPQTAVQELADGKDALASSLVETGHGRVLLLPLAHGGETRGVVALQGEGLSAGDAHLRRFTHQAAEALTRADEHDLQLESRRREEVLRGAARRLGTCTSAEVAAIAADALERALGVHASVTEVGGPQSGAGESRTTPLEQRVRVDLGPSLALMVEGQTLGESERHWMDDLRDVARDALARSLHHEQVQADLGVLRAGVEDFPAPLLVQASDGDPLASSRAFRDLGLAVPSAAGTAQEVTAGVPPREFVVAQARLEDGGRVTLYREVTVERDALRRKTELIATMGHELRTPLTSVLGYSQMMGRHLDVVRDQIGRLDTLLQEFLDTGRLGEGDQAQVALEALDARDLAQHAAERFRGRWEGRELRVDLGAPAPVAGEPVRLGQVLDNLLENAAKYSPPDRPIDLGVRMDAQEGRVLLSVRDEGDGIAPEHLPHLFERTFRVPGSRESGQGLGLSIVRDLVAAHGGEVSAHSEGLGCGSTFTVSLPAAPAGTPAGAPPPALDAPRGDAPGAEAARDAGAAAERR